jgi:hypothetical protein
MVSFAFHLAEPITPIAIQTVSIITHLRCIESAISAILADEVALTEAVVAFVVGSTRVVVVTSRPILCNGAGTHAAHAIACAWSLAAFSIGGAAHHALWTY